MKGAEDVEAAAQLMSKEEDQAVSHENFDIDYDEVDAAYSSYWSAKYRSSSRQLWLRMQSLPLPGWLPIRKLNQLNLRYLIFVFAISLAITVLIVNPYGPYRPAQTSSTPIATYISLGPTETRASSTLASIQDFSTSTSTQASSTSTSIETSSTPTLTKASSTPTSTKTSKSTPTRTSLALTPIATKSPNSTEIGNPSSPKLSDEFCTTWPVDEEGNYDLSTHDRSSQVEPYSIAPQGGWQKPEGVRIVAMVFFGRKRYVDILDCYLQQNLASNGGYLDEVWFMVHTKEDEDIQWLNRLVTKSQDYKIIGQKDCSTNNSKYGCLWKFATEDNTIYIKLDDDIVSYP